MTQDQVLRLLERSKKPLSGAEITEKLGVSNARTCIRKLLVNKDIKMVGKIVGIKVGVGVGVSRRLIPYYFV